MQLRRPIPLAATIAAIGLVGCNEDAVVPIGSDGGAGANDAGGGANDAGGGDLTAEEALAALQPVMQTLCERTAACDGYIPVSECAGLAAEYTEYLGEWFANDADCLQAYLAYFRCVTDEGECREYNADDTGEPFLDFGAADACVAELAKVYADCPETDYGYYDYGY